MCVMTQGEYIDVKKKYETIVKYSDIPNDRAAKCDEV